MFIFSCLIHTLLAFCFLAFCEYIFVPMFANRFYNNHTKSISFKKM